MLNDLKWNRITTMNPDKGRLHVASVGSIGRRHGAANQEQSGLRLNTIQAIRVPTVHVLFATTPIRCDLAGWSAPNLQCRPHSRHEQKEENDFKDSGVSTFTAELTAGQAETLIQQADQRVLATELIPESAP